MRYPSVSKSIVLSLAAISLAACGSTGVATHVEPAGTATATAASPSPTAVATPTPAPPAELTAEVSGVGRVEAVQEAELAFLVQGTVAEVLVDEGDQVTKGQVLARLDLRAFEQQIRQAEAAVAAARAQEAALKAPPRQADVAAANAQVRQAQITVEQASVAQTQDVRSAEAAVATTESNLEGTRDKLSAGKTQAETQMQQAAEALTQAQARYAQAKYNWEYAQETGNDPIQPEVTNQQTGRSRDNELSDGQREAYYAQFVQAEAALRSAEQQLAAAQVAYDAARAAEVAGVQQAEQQLAQARAALEKLRLPPEHDRVASAQASLDQARASRARLSPDPSAASQDQAAAGVQQAAAALELARINRDYAELRAPFAGMVADVTIAPGDPSASPTAPAISLVDVSMLRVEAPINDADIGLVRVGQPARVYVDALPEQALSGRVSFIAPAATVTGGVWTYTVRIDLDAHDGLRPGMSARVVIRTQEPEHRRIKP